MDLKKLKSLVEETAKGFEYELFLLRRKKLSVSTENGKLDRLTTAGDYGLGLRLLKDQRMGFAYASDLSPEGVKRLVSELAEITLHLPPDPANRLKETLEEATAPSPYDADGVSKPLEEKVELVTTFERSLTEADPRVVGTRETTFTETVYEVSFLNSYGVEFSYSGTSYFLVTGALAESPKGDRNIAWSYRGARYLSDLNLEKLKEELLFKLLETLDPEPFRTRSLPVVFFREAAAALLETFADLFLGSSAVKKKTPLLGKEGRKVASELITLVDDGTLDGGLATHPYDDEGTPQQRTVLIERGTFKGFLHSLYTAARSGAAPTGNGFRNSFSSPPEVSVSNFYLLPGEDSLEDLLRREGEVLLVTDLMGLHTADAVSGDFSFGASGVLYRGGKKVQAVRGVTVAGNFL
ncbi:MAG: TldD/PmbA family protein, partial [Aquificae bacterium]|nr:TldD/PmbA family protein [Aquificota bacterium]